MSDAFQCNIVNTEGALFSGMVTRAIIPGIEGEIGVVAGHSPLLTRLKSGVVRLRLAESEDKRLEDTIFFVAGGFVEVVPNCTTILADKAQRADHIDEAAAQAAKQHAQQLLAHHHQDLDYARALAQLAEAMARLQAVSELRRKLQRG